ncbi:MAG: hypothetical protein E7063_03060 [Spirochaetaceae bacterium]|nr:hypothetical protein [Spirochaetaceae bacterium]
MKDDKFYNPPIMVAIAESELQRFRKIETENTLLKVQIEDLEKLNEQLKQKLVGKENEFKYFSNSFQSKIKELQKQIEKMKCCENCKHFIKVLKYPEKFVDHFTHAMCIVKLLREKAYRDGYIAGAKENQPNAEEMIKRLLKGGYIKKGISEVKENLVFHNLIKNPNDLPKNNNKILFFAKDISCIKNHYLNRYSLGNYDAINKLFVANSPGYSKGFVITEVLYWWELAE